MASSLDSLARRLTPAEARAAGKHSAQTRDYLVDPFGSRQSSTICANRPLHRSKRDRCGGLNPLAASQIRGGRGLRSDSCRDFLGYHAPALRVGRGTASRNSGQAHRDYTLSVKSELPRIDPQFPRGVHVSRPRSRGSASQVRYAIYQ
jgi:hypothetical protein